jgi:predicted metal-binding membrane protein
MVYLGFGKLASDSTAAKWLPAASGAIFVVAGLYQFTPLKAACLRACRGPLDFILSHDFGGGSRSGFRAGLVHGAYCLGCCWALMTVLIVVGLMNLVWMAGLAVVFALEKNWRHGVGFDRLVGAALVLLGLTVLIDPHILIVVSGGQPPASPSGQM